MENVQHREYYVEREKLRLQTWRTVLVWRLLQSKDSTFLSFYFLKVAGRLM